MGWRTEAGDEIDDASEQNGLNERPKVQLEGARIILEGTFLSAFLTGKPQLDAGIENRTIFLFDAVASCLWTIRSWWTGDVFLPGGTLASETAAATTAK